METIILFIVMFFGFSIVLNYLLDIRTSLKKINNYLNYLITNHDRQYHRPEELK